MRRNALFVIALVLRACFGGEGTPAWAESVPPCRLYDTRNLGLPSIDDMAPSSIPLVEGIHGFSVQGSGWIWTGETWCHAPYGTREAVIEVAVFDARGPGSITLWGSTRLDPQNGHVWNPRPEPQLRWYGRRVRHVHRVRVRVALGLDWLPPDLLMLLVSPAGPVHITLDIVEAIP